MATSEPDKSSQDPAALARLAAVERQIETLHPALDFIGHSTPTAIIALAFGHRARSLYLGILHAIAGPSEATAQIALRVLVEQTITLPWLLLNRDVHPFLWKAEQERHLRSIIRDAPTKAGTRFAAGLAAQMPPDAIAVLDARISESRSLAAAKGVAVRPNGSLLPSIADMAAQVGTPEAKEAYHVAYNMMSGWTHSGAGGLGLTFTPDGIVLADGPVEDDAPIRAMAAKSYLYVLTIVSREAGLGIEDEAEALRQQLLVP